jgi:membrane protein DedA with SNARE-associated domain
MTPVLPDALLTALLVYGYPVLFAAVLVGALGVPVPAGVLILAAGGLAADGELELPLVLGLALAAAVLGDLGSFALARALGHAALARHGWRVGLGPATLAAARRRAGAWTGRSVFLTRWLATPVALPTTVVAAVAGYPVRSFAAMSVAGEAIWVGGYGGAGYLLGGAWPALVDAAADAAGLGAGVALLTVGAVGAALLCRPGRPLAGCRPRIANAGSATGGSVG